MMKFKVLGIGLVVVGVLIIVGVFLSVPLRLASPGYGIRKIIGLILGLFVLVAGIIINFSKGKDQKSS